MGRVIRPDEWDPVRLDPQCKYRAFRTLHGLPRLLLLVIAMLGGGCSDGPPESRLLDEPSSALRPESLGGSVLADARIADYELEAHLDTETHQVTGTARVQWRNTTELSVDTIPFHLYMNGFRAEDTAWMSMSKGRHRSSEQHEDGPWGYIDVKTVTLSPSTSGDPESAGPEPTALPWRENEDPSTMTVDLPYEVGPGEQIELELKFVTQLPKVVARTGFTDDFHAVAQWYPKIGVLDEEGWQAHTFTPNDEFYADFGNYRVELDVPADVEVGATGIRTAEAELEEGRKRLTYEAEMVHDFAWMADPNFVVLDASHNGIRIRQLIQPDLAETAVDHEVAVIAALDSYERRFGLYPWSTLTIVHPPEGAEGAGGMEYPTLFTTSDRAPIPNWVRRHVMDERMSGIFTTVHEFGHQYFQGLFASREHEQPWIDEGLNSMSNVLAHADQYPDDPWVLRLGNQKLYQADVSGLAAASRRANVIPVDRPASAFSEVPGAFGVTVYQKTSSLMLTLRNLVGHEAFDAVFRAYGEQARFRHPRGEDLERLFIERLGARVQLPVSAVGETVELDLEAYFEQALRTVRVVDFRLASLVHGRVVGEQGWRRDESGSLTGGEPPTYLEKDAEEMEDSEINSIVRVERAGHFHVPVELEVEFKDGSTERRVWHGNDPYVIYEWPGKRVMRAELDPDRKLLLERRRLDNVRLYRPSEGDPPDDGLSRPLGHLMEALSLVVLGGFLP